MADQTPLLRDLAVQAVRKLLEVIIDDPKGYPGNSSSGSIQATHASLAAQAIRDLMSVTAIGDAVGSELKKVRHE